MPVPVGKLAGGSSTEDLIGSNRSLNSAGQAQSLSRASSMDSIYAASRNVYRFVYSVEVTTALRRLLTIGGSAPEDQEELVYLLEDGEYLNRPVTSSKPVTKKGIGFQPTISKLPEIYADFLQIRKLQTTSRSTARRRNSRLLETISEGKKERFKKKDGSSKKQKPVNPPAAKAVTANGKSGKLLIKRKQSQGPVSKKDLKDTSGKRTVPTPSLSSSSTPRLPVIFELTSSTKLHSMSDRQIRTR